MTSRLENLILRDMRADQSWLLDLEDTLHGIAAGWLRFGIADPRYNPIASYLGGGLVYTGLTPGRSDDQVGISFASANFGDRYRQGQAITGATIDKREVVVEAVYNAIVTPWLSVQPDLQYVANPGGDAELADALVIGLRVKIGR